VIDITVIIVIGIITTSAIMATTIGTMMVGGGIRDIIMASHRLWFSISIVMTTSPSHLLHIV